MTDVSRKLGYGGSATVDGTQLLITSGSYSSASATSFLQMVDTPPATSQRNRVIHADGTRSYTGSLAFDVTEDAMGLFTAGTLFGRWYDFDVGIYDGNSGYSMSDCKVSNLSLTGAVGGLLNASLSFLGKTGFQSDSVTADFIRDDKLVAYWWSGAKSPLKAKSWTLTMTQESTPVYCNIDDMEPLYLRVGLVEYSLEVESYTPMGVGTSNVIYIETKTFTLTGTTSEEGFQYNGVTDLGTYRYAFSTGTATGDSSGTVLTIT